MMRRRCQSASDRQTAAFARGRSSSSARRCANPSLIAEGVIDCSHSRWIGLFVDAYWTM